MIDAHVSILGILQQIVNVYKIKEHFFNILMTVSVVKNFKIYFILTTQILNTIIFNIYLPITTKNQSTSYLYIYRVNLTAKMIMKRQNYS